MFQPVEDYDLENVEQMRVIADELRQRIFHALTSEQMTVTQVGGVLGLSPAKIHYHVRELERVKLVRLVETQEKGGILEKYYRSISRSLHIPPALLGSSTEELSHAVIEMMREINEGVSQALRSKEVPDNSSTVALGRIYRWMTDEEVQEVVDTMARSTNRFRDPRRINGERLYTIVALAYPANKKDAESESPVEDELAVDRGKEPG